MIIIICILLLVFIAVDYAALRAYTRLVSTLREGVVSDWGSLATGESGSIEFERLWLRTAQNEFRKLSKLPIDKS